MNIPWATLLFNENLQAEKPIENGDIMKIYNRFNGSVFILCGLLMTGVACAEKQDAQSTNHKIINSTLESDGSLVIKYTRHRLTPEEIALTDRQERLVGVDEIVVTANCTDTSTGTGEEEARALNQLKN